MLTYAFLGLIVVLISLLAIPIVTGHCRRGYTVLPTDAAITIRGKEISLQAIAARYQPVIFLRQNKSSPPSIKMWYEAIQEEVTDHTIGLSKAIENLMTKKGET